MSSRFDRSFYQGLGWGLGLAVALEAISGLVFYVGYNVAIKTRKKKIEEKLAGGLVYRDTVSKPDKIIKALELHPSFVRAHAASWQLCSMGEYLTTLRFYPDDDEHGSNKDSPKAKILEKELYVVIATMMMKALGENMGAKFLPILGMKPAESMFETISSKIVSYIVANVLTEASASNSWDPTEDMAAMPLNVSELMR